MTKYPKVHNRDHFFKYVTSDVAKLIIRNHTLKWSCPLDFNDPFDHQFAFITEDRTELISNQIIQRIAEYVWDRDDVTFDTTHDPLGFGLMLTHLKQMKNVIPREEFLRNAKAILPQTVDSSKQALTDFYEEISLFLRQTRVLCLAEEKDNLLMWSHYSESHTGAVFKLNAIDELDSPFLVAKKVEYSAEYPSLATEEEWLNHLLYINRIDFGKRHFNLCYVKGDVWGYEKEWRISITSEKHPLGEAVYNGEPPEVFGAIYLGCRMPKEDKQQIMDLANQNLPNMEVWQAIQGSKAYKIEFQQLK